MHIINKRGLYKRIFLCIAALFAGGIIYIYFRIQPPAILHNSGLIPNKVPVSENIPEWIIYSLPGGLWAFAYASLISTIWWGRLSHFKYLWLASIPLLIFGFELLQLTAIIPGTYCIQDILLGFAGMCTGFLTGIQPLKPIYYEKTPT